MKKKEMKNLAAKIAKCERIIMLNEDPKAVKQAEEEIMRISSSVHSLEDMVAIDELVMEMLEKKLKNFLTFQKFFDIIFT